MIFILASDTADKMFLILLVFPEDDNLDKAVA